MLLHFHSAMVFTASALIAAFFLARMASAGGHIIDTSFFTHTAMRVLIGADPPTSFMVLNVTEAEFPALAHQGVSYVVQQYATSSVNTPHSHPQSAELLFLLTGSLEVGFIDTGNKLHVQMLQAGDMFLFPKGLVHYQFNYGQDSAFALSAFGCANAETIRVHESVSSKSFKIDVTTLQKIKDGLAQEA